MNPDPKRRWPRFTLRTLFVIVSIAGVWFGYHADWIRKRHQALERIDDHPPIFTMVGGLSPSGELPWSLRLLGEHPRAFIELEVDDDLNGPVDKMRGLFPEAWIQPYRNPAAKPGNPAAP